MRIRHAEIRLTYVVDDTRKKITVRSMDAANIPEAVNQNVADLIEDGYKVEQDKAG
jgi:hypothetical protein